LSLGQVGPCFPDRCISRDCALEVLPGVLSTVTSEFVRFYEFTDATDTTADAFANKGVAHVRLLNTTKDWPAGRPLDVYFSHTQSDPDPGADNSDIRRVQFEEDIRGFLRKQPGFGDDAVPDHDTLFVGDLNVVGREPGYDPAPECLEGGLDRASEWSMEIGGDCSELVAAGFRDAWWLLNPVQDPGLTAAYGTDERLDYLLFNFSTDPTVAAPLPSGEGVLRPRNPSPLQTQAMIVDANPPPIDNSARSPISPPAARDSGTVDGRKIDG
jgi:hypothetical protein